MRRALVFFANHMTVRVVANSRAAKDALIECGGRGDKISVVYNGFDFTADLPDSGAERDAVLGRPAYRIGRRSACSAGSRNGRASTS